MILHITLSVYMKKTKPVNDEARTKITYRLILKMFWKLVDNALKNEGVYSSLNGIQILQTLMRSNYCP